MKNKEYKSRDLYSLYKFYEAAMKNKECLS